MTARGKATGDDLARADRSTIPVNLIYPPNYSAEKGGIPAILLEETISPQDALDTLDIIEQFAAKAK